MFEKKRKYLNIRSFVVYILILAVALFLIVMAVSSFSDSANNEAKKVTEQAILNALITCYSIEGSYPPDISYLEQNYGVHIDHEKYIVDYQIFATNVLPDVALIPIGR